MPSQTCQQPTQTYTTLVLQQDNILCQVVDSGYIPCILSLPIIDAAHGQVTLNLSHQHTTDALTPVLDAAITDSMLTTAKISHAISASFAHEHGIIWENQAQFIPYRTLLASLDASMLTTITHAMQLLRWQEETQFCSRCATPAIAHHSGEPAMVCPNCDLRQYPRIQPCVIIAITRTNPETLKPQILLAHHHRHTKPNQRPMYGLIAGFVEVGESLEQAIHREVMEEVGLSVDNIRYIDSQPWPYPSNLMMGFIVDYQKGDIVLEEAELRDAHFFDIDDLPRIPAKGTIAHQLIETVAQS